MPDTKKFIEEVKKVGLSSGYKTRSAIERKIKNLEPRERQQIRRFWQGFKMPPSQIREALKSLKEKGVLKTTPYSILKKAKENIAQAEAFKLAEEKKERTKRTAQFYTRQRADEEKTKTGLSPRATVEESMKQGEKDKEVYQTLEQARKGEITQPPKDQREKEQTPAPFLKEMIID